MPSNTIVITLACVFAALAAASCGKGAPPGADPAAFEIEKRYERGPVTLTLQVSRKQITLADRLTLVLDASAPEDYEVELPAFGDKLDQFGIVDYRNPPPKLLGGGRVRTQRGYVLDPFLSGDYKIPPMKVSFWKKGEADPKKHEVETEEVTVAVRSVLPERHAELKIREIAGPVDLPPRAGGTAWAIAGGTAAAVGLAAWLILRRRRSPRAAASTPAAAHEVAYARLRALLAERLIEAGRVKEFHLRLSDVLRYYIEDRFGLRAPERTTEEFLDELRGRDVLDARYRPLLKAFLTHCDLVKFAEYQPEGGEIQKTFDAGKAFIEATRLDAKAVEAAGVSA